MSLTTCVLCKGETSDAFFFAKDTKGKVIFVCTPCEGKYGPKTRDVLKQRGFKLEFDSQHDKAEEKPFSCTLEYSGGTKQDIIQVILGLMDQENITLEDLEANQW